MVYWMQKLVSRMRNQNFFIAFRKLETQKYQKNDFFAILVPDSAV